MHSRLAQLSARINARSKSSRTTRTPARPASPIRIVALLALAGTLATVSVAAEAKKKRKHPADSVASSQSDLPGPTYGDRADVRAFISEMVAKHGFVQRELETLFARVHFNATVARLMTPATSTEPRSWHNYRARFVEPIRIKAGVQFWQNNQAALERAEREFGIPAEIIVGIVGIETIYGRNPGKFRVVDSLTTLAFDYPKTAKDRSSFFRSELEDYLLFARDGDMDIFSLRGSYAGAIGIPQFMPGSYRRYALDYDQDGKIDLRNDAIDAIGSVANFLAQHGWKAGVPVYYPARLKDNENVNLDELARLIEGGSEPQFHLADMLHAGLANTVAMPADAPLALIDLPNGSINNVPAPTDYVFGTQNFNVLTRYNRSYFYAMAVTELGSTIKAEVRAAELAGGKPGNQIRQTGN